jgi:NADPH2:quinone reductase
MKAVLCRNWGPPETLAVEDLPSPRPGRGQISVSVKASGVNFPDVLLIQNKYQFKPELPFSPGSEIAGVVKEVGQGVRAGKIKPLVSATYPLERAADALNDLVNRKVHGKVVLVA